MTPILGICLGLLAFISVYGIATLLYSRHLPTLPEMLEIARPKKRTEK